MVDGLAVGSILIPPDTDGYRELLRLMPGEVPDANTALVSAALALASDDPSASLHHLTRADDLREPATESIQFQVTAAVLRAGLCAETGGIDAAIRADDDADRLLALLPPGQLTAHPELGALALPSRGTTQLWRGDTEAAERTLTAALDATSARGATFLRLQCLGRLALLNAMRGRLRRAHKFGGAADHLATESALSPRNRPAAAAVALAWAYAQQCRDERSRHWLARAEQTDVDSERRFLAPVMALIRAELSSQSARAALQQLISVDAASIPVPWIRERVVTQIADLQVAQHRPDLARQALAELPEPHSARMTMTLNRLPAADGRCLPVPATQLHDASAALDLQVQGLAGSSVLPRRPAPAPVRGHGRRPCLATRRSRTDAPPIRRLHTGCARHRAQQHRRTRDRVASRTTLIRARWRQNQFRHSVQTQDAADVRTIDRSRDSERPRAGSPPASCRTAATNEIGAAMFVSVNTVRTHIRSILRELAVSG